MKSFWCRPAGRRRREASVVESVVKEAAALGWSHRYPVEGDELAVSDAEGLGEKQQNGAAASRQKILVSTSQPAAAVAPATVLFAVAEP